MRGGRPEEADVAELPVVGRGAVTEADLDVNGHMNVLVHLRLLTDATVIGLAPGGLGPGYPTLHGCGIFSVDHHVQYLSELRLGDQYTTHLRLLGASDRAVHTMVYLRDVRRQRVSTTLETLFINVNHGTRRAAAFPSEVRRPLAELARRDADLRWPAPTCGSIELPGQPISV